MCTQLTTHKTPFSSNKQIVPININETGMCYKMYKRLLFSNTRAYLRILINVSRNKRGLRTILNIISSNTTPSAPSPLSKFLILIGNLLMWSRLLLWSFVIKRQTKCCPFRLTYFIIFFFICDQIPGYRLKLANSPVLYSFFKRSFRSHSVA